jgi:hypothetical protein
MDTILIVPTVGALRNTFPIALETYKLSRTPTSTEVTKLHTCVKANLKAITCLLPNTEDIEWAWIIQTLQEWAELFKEKIADDANYVPPPLPVLRNPGLFTIESKWSNIEITREKETYHQQLYLHTYKSLRSMQWMSSLEISRFPFVSSRGHNYIFILYDYDSNAILAEPIKSRQTEHLIQGYEACYKRLTRAGITPILQRLDNEISKELIHCIERKLL